MRENLISNMRKKAVHSEYASDAEGKSLFLDEFVENSSESNKCKSEEEDHYHPTKKPKLKR